MNEAEDCGGHGRREPEDSMEFKPNMSDIGPVNDAYFAAKAKYRGYPGLGPTTSQADVMQEKVNEPSMYGIDDTDSVRYNKFVDVAGKPVVWVEYNDKDETACKFEIQNIPNEQAHRILVDVLPKLLELYMKKSMDYGGDVGDLADLGAKATFVDMWRKMGKLKRALWDGVELEGEGPKEIMMDLVGHIFIILDKMAR
jgi:hypothetical protein